jgi:lipoprotein-releasing system permease protein
MFNSFERLVAFRYLRPRRKQGFVSVIAILSFLGIMIGVGALIVVMSVMNGFRYELVSQTVGLNGHISVYSLTGRSIPNYQGLVDRVRAVEGVRQVMPVIEGQALVSANGIAAGAAVRGVVPDQFLNRPSIAKNLSILAPDAFQGRDAVMIGYRMAADFRVSLGGELTLVVPQGNATAFGTVPRSKTYQVVGIFDSGLYQYDAGYIYMPLEAAQVLYQLRGRVSGLDVFVDDPDNLTADKARISAAMGNDGRVYDWQQANASYFNVLAVERNVMFLILTLIIVVAALNVISGMIMLVKDKTGDIAILRTMGATAGSILRIFFITGASIGIVGTLFGLLLGLAIADNLENLRQWLQQRLGTTIFDAEFYFISQLPSHIEYREVVLVVAMSLGLSFLATIYPSWRAARIDPVEALRYE